MPLAYSEADFTAAVTEDAAGHRLPYRLLAPPASAPAARHPLVLFLHGAGERGTDNRAQLRNGAAPLFVSPEARAAHPCFVLLPQCPPGARWAEVDWAAPAHTLPPAPSVPLGQALALLDHLIETRPVDPRRIYAVGLSMGAFGVWDALCRTSGRTPGRFAAAIAICGGGDPAQAPRLHDVPVWAFHGARDDVVQPARSRAMVDALRRDAAARPGHAELRYTEYPDAGHDAWSRAFTEPDLLPWLFAQHRPA